MANRQLHKWATLPALIVCLTALAPSMLLAQGLPTTEALEGAAAAYDLSFTTDAASTLSGSVVIDQMDEANGLEIVFSGGEVRIDALADGERTVLAKPKSLPEAEGPIRVVIRRRISHVDVLVDQAIVTKAYLDSPASGSVGLAFAEGAASDVLLQPVDKVTFAEDFSWDDEGNAASQWEIVTGEWSDQKAGDWNNAAAEDRQTDFQGANLFAYVGRSEGPALVIAGHPHWSNYVIRSAVRSNSGDPMGLAACYADPDNFLLFRMTSQLSTADDADEMQLLLYRRGERILLASEPGGFVPGQWYSLGLRVQDGRVEALLDHSTVLTAADVPTASRGQIGLYCEGQDGVKFDDVEVAGWRRLSDTFATTDLSSWQGTSDGWGVRETDQARQHVLEHTGVGPSLLLSRDDDWEWVRYSADVDLSAGPGALRFNEFDDTNYAEVSWRKMGAIEPGLNGTRLELATTLEGVTTALGEATARIPEGGWARMRIETRDDLVRVFMDDKLLFEDLEDVLLSGKVGIVGMQGARIDDVVVESISRPQAARVTTQFTQEDTMREWASVAGAWVAEAAPAPQAVAGFRRGLVQDDGRTLYWNKGDFYGDITTEVTMPTVDPAGTAATFLLCADIDSGDDAYAFTLSPNGSAGLDVRLRRQAAEIAQGSTETLALPASIILARRGDLLTASVNGATVVKFRDRTPLTGTRIGILTDGLSVSAANVVASCSAQRDYTFSSAPTDWITRTGIWDMTSRWTCSPQWTWFSGADDGGPAVMWSKRAFSGDITVDMYASIKMGLGDGGASYKHPNDINLAICGDGENLASGYTVVLGGPLDTPTQIRRGDRILAQTSDPAARLPRLADGMLSTNEFHRKWWQVRLQKQGPRLRLFYETECVLDVIDPEPLEGGHVALWTFDNGIMVARANIFGEEREEILEPRASDVRIAAAHQAAETPTPPAPITISTATHPGIFLDFERDLGSCVTRDADQGAVMARDTSTAASGQGSLAACNENAGGTFGVTVVSEPFDAMQLGRLSFSYRVTDGVRVNLLLRTATRDYIVGFTGPEKVMTGQIFLGQLDGIVRDGEWHHADFDIRGHLYRAVPDLTDTTITEVAFGQFLRDKMLSAGLTGNLANATWWLDDFALYGPGGDAAQFEIADATGECAEVVCAIDRNPATALAGPDASVVALAPPAEGGAPVGVLAATVTEPGAWWVHVAARQADGTLLPPMHRRFVVDGDVPVVGESTPAVGDVAATGVIRIGLTDNGAGIQPASIKVSALGEEYTVADPALSYDPVAGEVELNLALLRAPLPTSGDLEVAVLEAADYAGRTISTPSAMHYVLDASRDTTAPSAPVIIAGGAAFVDNDFESLAPSSFGQFAPVPSTGSAVGLDESTSADGRSSLEVYCTETGPTFQAYATTAVFDAGVYPTVSFDYKFDQWLRVDLTVYMAAGYNFAVKLTDADSSYGVYGSAPGIVADSRWRHVDIPLYDIIRANLPALEDYTVAALSIGGGGWPGNPEGASYHLDNFQIVSVASAAGGLTCQWSAPDASGLAGASYVVDALPDTEPDTIADTTAPSITISDVADGETYLHVRVVDGAGNWGPATHHRCILDSQPAAAIASSPPANQSSCASQIVLNVTDQGPAGVDPSSIVLSIAGTDYGIGDPALTYNSASGQLVWEGQLAQPEPIAFGNGATVPIHLVSASDFAGNPATPDVSWSFVMDYALDDAPPLAPHVVSSTHPTAVFNPFEGTVEQGALGSWIGRGGTALAVDTSTAASGASSLKMTFVEGNQFRADVGAPAFEAVTTPYLSFDYCIPPEAQVDMLLVVNGSQVLVNLTDNESSAASRVPGMVADGQWHHVEGFDLTASAVAVVGAVGTYSVSIISIQDAGATETPVGTSVWFDNFMVYQAGAGAPAFSWSVTDATGIAGYSYLSDDQPGTIPGDGVIDASKSLTLEAPAAGTHYLHIKALDGAGKWGPVTHYAIVQGG